MAIIFLQDNNIPETSPNQIWPFPEPTNDGVEVPYPCIPDWPWPTDEVHPDEVISPTTSWQLLYGCLQNWIPPKLNLAQDTPEQAYSRAMKVVD